MARIDAFLKHFCAYLLGCEEGLEVSIITSKQKGLIAISFSRYGNCTNNLDLTTFANQYISGMNISYLAAQMLKLLSCSYHIVQQIPYLSLHKIFFKSVSIRNLGLQHEFVVLISQLNNSKCTRATPPEPHMPTL